MALCRRHGSLQKKLGGDKGVPTPRALPQLLSLSCSGPVPAPAEGAK